MPPEQTASLSQPTRPLPERIELLPFLRRELAPFPGRSVATFRTVVACVTVLWLCMALRVPSAYLAVFMVVRFAMGESSQTLLSGIVFLLALTSAIAIALVLLIVAMDQPWLRFCLMAAMAALAFFLRRTFVIGALGFVIGLIGTLIMTLPDYVPVAELVVRGTLWLWPVFALGIVAAVAANLLIAPTDPETVLRTELVARLRATEDALAGGRLGTAGHAAGVRRLATAGITNLLALLKSAEVAHPSIKPRHAQYSAVITLADRLVTAAAALELLSAAPLRADEQERLARVAADCAHLRRALEERHVSERPPRIEGRQPAAGGGSARLPVIIELEHAVDLIQQALGPEAAAAQAASSDADHGRLFVPDAFTNPEYIHDALRGALAVMVCYILQSAVDWPDIHTSIITCMIVGLASEGAMIQKATLRISGAVVGAAMGFLAILFLIPHMESITSLTLLVAAGTAVAAWVVVGSPRISYAGVQIALAFYMCVIQGFEPTWYFYTIRDRLVGILLGNTVITLVFHYVWPVQASVAMWRSLGSALRAMAQLAIVDNRSNDQTVVAREAQSLRLTASVDFAAAQQLADEAAFELSGDGSTGLGAAARERLQRATADAQSVFLTQLALARQRPDAAPAELPDALRRGVRRFDAVVGESLTAIADRAQHTVGRALPDLRAPLAAVTDVISAEAAAIASPEVAAQIEGRLALYRELVPRIEQLGVAEFAE